MPLVPRKGVLAIAAVIDVAINASTRPSLSASKLINEIVRPALDETERAVSVALGRINIDDMAKRAESLK